MKASRIVDCHGLNPGYDHREKLRVEAAGGQYSIDKQIHYKAGTINEHPDVWRLCCLPKPLCRPLDDECKAKVEEFLSHPARKSHLAKLKRLASPEVFEKLPKGMQDYVRAISEKWKLNDPDRGDARPVYEEPSLTTFEPDADE